MKKNKKYHYVYLITNIINDKDYVGVRSSDVHPSLDEYWGSGVLIAKAIAKHGKHNFVKRIIKICKSRARALKIESLIVDEEWVKDKGNYNICTGGQGMSAIDMYGEKNPFYGKTHTKENRDKFSKLHTGNSYALGNKWSETSKKKLSEICQGRVISESAKKKISIAMKNRILTKEHKHNIAQSLKGKPLTEQRKKNISEALKGKHLGRKYPIVECPICHHTGALNNMKRYHFDNCKYNNED